MASNPDSLLASYLLEERIGVGGMAEVFRARREGPGGFAKELAIKRVLPDLARDPQWVAMFLEEARLASRFSCRNLVQVFDFGEADGVYYLAMEYIDGVDLATLLADRHLPVDLAAHLGIELCEALEHIHQARGEDGELLGVVHRDITPGNVLLSIAGDVKLGDFGIARARARAVRTAGGAIKGKLAYLSPEQARGDEVDARTDIYGLGVCLFEALTGQRYLGGDGEVALLRAAERPPIEKLTELDQPALVRETLARALAIEPARRFPDAPRFAEALRGWIEQYQADRLRRALGKIVAGSKRRSATTSSVTPERAPPRAPAPPRIPPTREPASEQDPTPARTEVRDVLSEQPRRRLLPFLVAALLASAAGAVVYYAWPAGSTATGTSPPAGFDAGTIVAAGELDGGATIPVAPPVTPATPVDVAVDAAAPAVHSPDRPRPFSAPPAPTIAIDAGIVGPSDAAPPPAGEDAELVRARELLVAIDRAVKQRGLLPQDVPDLDARRRRLATAVSRGDRPMTELVSLERAINSFVIDRNFIDKKLQRLNKRLAKQQLQPAVANRLEGQAQRALSHSVNGRYDLANRELNAIAAVVEP